MTCLGSIQGGVLLLRSTIRLSWVLGTFALVAPRAVHAQADDAGRIHFMAGASDYESGDYEHALLEFQRAYELSQRPALFYNIALSYQQLGDLAHAIEYLDRYLNEVEDIPNRAALERRRENLRRRLAAQQAAEQTSEPQPQTNEAQNEPQTNEAQNEPQTHEAQNEPQTNEAQNEPQTHEAQTNEAQNEPRTDEPEPTAAVHEPQSANVPAIASFIGGGVGLVVAVVFGGLAIREKNRVAGLDCATTATCDEVPGANPSRMDTYALLSDVGTGLAIVGVGLGVVFLLTGGDDEEATSASLRVAPYASPGAAGLAARGRF